MNISYQQNSKHNSNNDIFETYFTESTLSAGALRRTLDRILAFLSRILLILTSARIKAYLRVGGVAIALIGMICVIAAIESGALSIIGGLFTGILLIGIEFLCLRHH